MKNQVCNFSRGDHAESKMHLLNIWEKAELSSPVWAVWPLWLSNFIFFPLKYGENGEEHQGHGIISIGWSEQQRSWIVTDNPAQNPTIQHKIQGRERERSEEP